MRKVLVAILCLVFLGACTRKDVEEQTEIPGNRLELGVRSGDVVTPVSMSAWVYQLTELEPEVAFKQTYFAASETISFQDMLPGKYTFFILGNEKEDTRVGFLANNELKAMRLEWWDSDTIPELFGGIVTADGSEEMMKVEMTRLVGGVNVNVTNYSDFQGFRLTVSYGGESEVIQLGDYALETHVYNLWGVSVGKEFYLFPTKEPLRGEIVAYDENGQEYYFDFESKNTVQRNKRLELNLTLNKASSIGRSANVINTVTCVEKVTEL